MNKERNVRAFQLGWAGLTSLTLVCAGLRPAYAGGLNPPPGLNQPTLKALAQIKLRLAIIEKILSLRSPGLRFVMREAVAG
jgi:hypothetical protein